MLHYICASSTDNFQFKMYLCTTVHCSGGRGGSLVHYSQGVRISNFHRFFTKPPTPPCISSPQCICVFYYLSLVLRVSGDRKLGIGLLPAPPLLPNFGGNGNFHILAEIENIKSGSGGEYLLYMHQRVMQFRKLSKYWLCTLWNDTPILKQDAH